MLEKVIYHGSDRIVDAPKMECGREDNDYGKGFYTTEDIEKARAWAVVNGNKEAICNKYELDMDGLKSLYLDECGVLSWIAEVVSHRGVIDENALYAANALVEKYKLDTSTYDVIIGYRADDSYTKVIDAFLQGQINTEETLRFFKKGELGQQLFVKTEKAFSHLKFVGYEEVKDGEKYEGYDIRARKEVETFLDNRRKEIQLNGFRPNGITIQSAISEHYIFNSEYNYYYVEKEEDGVGVGEEEHNVSL